MQRLADYGNKDNDGKKEQNSSKHSGLQKLQHASILGFVLIGLNPEIGDLTDIGVARKVNPRFINSSLPARSWALPRLTT